MAESADLILENASIITCDPLRPPAEAVAVHHGRILAVGSVREISAFKSVKTRVIDCQGRTLVPGFIDAHCHFFSALRRLFSLDLGPEAVRSITEMQAVLQRKTADIPPGVWISGTDYNEFYLAEKRPPTRYELDAAAPNHPVIITHRSLHACVLNSAALQELGLNNESEEPPGGIIDRDLASGELNGILYEMLPWVQARIHSPLPDKEYRRGIVQLNRRNLEMGITSFADATVTNDLAQFEVFSELVNTGAIQSRVNMMLGYDHLPEYRKARSGVRAANLKLKISGLKMVLSEAAGRLRPEQRDLNRMVLEANQCGCQVVIHAVTQTAVEAAVTALEYAGKRLPAADRRNRIEHCSECPPDLISRLAKLHTVIVTQPPFLYFQGERYLSQVPLETQAFLYPFKSLIDSGVMVAGSSDSPVVSNNPLVGIYSAVTRRAKSGQLLLPAERLTPDQALSMYTLNAAYAGFDQAQKGTISQGKLADIVMLSDNPLSCPPERIKDIRVERTIIGGDIVWESPASAVPE